MPTGSTDFTFRLKVTKEEGRVLATYLNSLTTSDLLFGLRFAYNRKKAEEGGYLLPGRKSLVKKETHLLSSSQAAWRLDNWKAMISTYREKGYSYPTISRIKKILVEIAGRK